MIKPYFNQGMRSDRQDHYPQLCLVFDLDDTLFLEREYIQSGFESVGAWVRQRFPITDFSERAFRRFEGGLRGNIFDVILTDSGCPHSSDDIQTMVRIYREHVPKISLLPDAREFLQVMHQQCRMAVIRDGPLVSQQQKFRALGLKAFCGVAVFTGAWGKAFYKPHARAFRLVARCLRSPGMRYCYIGDNPDKDFITPHAMGWGTVRVRRSLGLHSMRESSIRPPAHLEVTDMRDLIAHLCEGQS